MGQESDIEWTDATWNPVTGCDKISAGCKFCYAEAMATRLKAMRNPRYTNGFELTLQSDQVELPLRWARPRVIFVNSMSDLFHRDIPATYIARVFDTMKKASWHTFQVLTKRSDRLLEIAADLPWPENVWMGVSVESPKVMGRVEDLQKVGAAVRFLSVEPLIERIPNLALDGIGWVIVGGESGRSSRPMDASWVVELRDQCVGRGVPFFFKQWGGRNKKAAGRTLEGRTWDEMPTRSQAPLIAAK